MTIQLNSGFPPRRGLARRCKKNMPIRYEYNQEISREQFVSLLKRSTLAERRPVDDADRIDSMLKHANLVCTAWNAERLVGVARSVTDFEYFCYLSDLAVDMDYQRQGIGKQLIRLTQSRLGESAKLILLSAPKSTEYYPKIGFDPHSSAWVIESRKELK
jgi:predicted N-acetyltransferase YhbS